MTPEEIQKLRQDNYNATVVHLQEVNPELRIMRVKPDFELPPHKPGQYGTLGLGNWEPRVEGVQEEELPPEKLTHVVRRAYSISCPVLGEDNQLFDFDSVDWLEFYVVLVRNSGKSQGPALTPRLFTLKEGDRLVLGTKITGHYTSDPVKPGDNVIFLSTGTGEAPHNYMVWELLRNGHQGKILSVCCVRHKTDLGYLDVQETLMDNYENFMYLWLTTREPKIMKKMYIQDLIKSGQLEDALEAPLNPDSTHIYLCGNPAMIGVPKIDKETGERDYPSTEGVIEILENKGFTIDQSHPKVVGNIHFEEYW